MRVRYQYVNNQVQAECDLTEKKARKLFKELEKEVLCEWAELVAEDEEEGGYMQIIGSWEHIQFARNMHKLFKEFSGLF